MADADFVASDRWFDLQGWSLLNAVLRLGQMSLLPRQFRGRGAHRRNAERFAQLLTVACDDCDFTAAACLGSPYIACFKTCVAMIARGMNDPRGGFYPEDQFAVILDRNDWQTEALDAFYKMKDAAVFRDRNRLATCAPASAEEVTELQTADLIAYDTFKLLHGAKGGLLKARKSLESMFDKNGFQGLYYGKHTLEAIKPTLEAAVNCAPNGFIINLTPEWETAA